MIGIGIAALPGHRQAQSQVTVDFVGRGEKNERIVSGLAGGVQYIERAAEIHLEIHQGIENRGGHSHLGGQVIDFSCRDDSFFHQLEVAHVAHGAAPARFQNVKVGILK